MKPFAFAITADSKVIGSIGVFRQGNIHRQTAELGILYCRRSYWGKGLMTEAKNKSAHMFLKRVILSGIYAEPFCTQYSVLSSA